jgi:cytoskeletal protein CcmA (bactofilin family)
MALWNEKNATPEPMPAAPPGGELRPRPAVAAVPGATAASAAAAAAAADASHRAKDRTETLKESALAAELTIEGKISGNGSIRIAGRFKGDLSVKGSVTIEAGAHVEGEINAGTVVIAGELAGNILNARQVDVLATGVITGDVKAGSITVAAGSRMRGHVEFGWEPTAGMPNGSLTAGH